MPTVYWQAPEFEYREKGPGWYWTSIICAVLLLGIAIWTHNFLFATFVVIAEILVIIWGNKEPSFVWFALSDKGLRINEKVFYPLSDILEFSFDEREGDEWHVCIVHLNRRFKHVLHILVPDDQMEAIRGFLGERVVEIPHQDTLSDSIERFLGF